MNLLTDPLLRVVTGHGEQRLSLPGLMALMGRGEVQHLSGIQQHQEDAFHVFLCYVAGAILARRGQTDPVQSEEYWREGLRELSGAAGDDAWTLVVNDVSRPAFMQPPLPKEDYGKPLAMSVTPDELDLLITAKNHEVKQVRAIHAEPDQWVYALLSLQTMSGYSGGGGKYRGISRMNGGHGNRSVAELVRGRTPGIRWCDAVSRLLEHRKEILAGAYGYDPKGLVLVWLEPWDGTASLPLSRLDPFYIEICRRTRLCGGDDITCAKHFGSSADRIAAKELKGIVGDPWLPVDLGSGDARSAAAEKALTIPPSGLTPEILRRLVFADGLRLTALQRPQSDWRGQVWLTVSVLVRGQGTTDGFHARHIPIPPPAQPRLFGPPAQREPLAQLAKSAIEYAGKLQNRVLKPAVFVYLEGAPTSIQFDRASAKLWWQRFANRFDSLWSAVYFRWLWSAPDPLDEETLLNDWARLLRDHALSVLREVAATMPQHAGRQYRTRVRAERAFWDALYREFPQLKEEKHEHGASS